MSTSPAVVVCGTVNVDTFVGVRQFPAAGETVIAEPLGSPGLGGKGANQAVAAARFLADGPAGVLLLATVGEDAPGDGALAALRDAGVDVTGVARTDELPTGSAFIMNDGAGENIIVVTSGANTVTDPAASLGHPGTDGARVLLAQGELTPEHSAALPRLADGLGARLVLNLAPVTTRDPALLAAADPLVVNESEAADVLGLPRDIGLDEVLDALATAVVERGLARSAVVTLGAHGALVIGGDSGDSDDGDSSCRTTVPSPTPAQVVDTTGAGDAFCGTLAAALAQGKGLRDAAKLAVAAGSLAVESQGAASSYATGRAVRALAAEQG
ncbi:ribokinase [Corynebacterium nuruki]|uniref:ribokinase n=1 Tax=Corynebacterium nuruki TaxID=1032851 RepID=UPI000494EEEB|nr:ribokinase [Corynebacterium nuruki]